MSPSINDSHRKHKPESRRKWSPFGKHNWIVLPYTVLLSFVGIMVLWMSFEPKKENAKGTIGEALTVLIILCLQGVALLATCVSVFRNFKYIAISDVFTIFFSKVVFFGTAYILCWIRQNHAFDQPDWFNEQSYASICMCFMYYSMSTMTLTGQGAIWPVSVLTEGMSIVQSIFGVSYTIFTISQAVDMITKRFRHPKVLQRSSWWSRNVVYRPCIRKTRRCLRSVLLLIVTAVQAAKIIYFGINDSDVLTKYRCTMKEFAVAVASDVTLLLIIISTSAKMIRWDHRNRDISIWFLFQSYFSCAIIFAGIYIDFQAVAKNYDIPFIPTVQDPGEDLAYSTVVLDFIHFAFATQTALGQTGNIQPRRAMAYLLIIVQMGQSFIFHTYIFGLGLLKIRTSRLSPSGRQRFLLAMSKARGSCRFLNEPFVSEDDISVCDDILKSSEVGSYYPFSVGGLNDENSQVVEGRSEPPTGSGCFYSAGRRSEIRSMIG